MSELSGQAQLDKLDIPGSAFQSAFGSQGHIWHVIGTPFGPQSGTPKFVTIVTNPPADVLGLQGRLWSPFLRPKGTFDTGFTKPLFLQ